MELSNVKAIGWFGRYEDDEYTQDEKRVEYLRLPQSYNIRSMPDKLILARPFDLNAKHPTIKDEARVNGTTYEHIYKWIMLNTKDKNNQPCLPNVEFVCKKSELANLMTAREENRNYIIQAAKRDGIIYFRLKWLSDFEFNIKRKLWELKPTVNTVPQKVDKQTRYGTKFEHCLLADKPNGVPDPQRPILRYDDVSCMYRAQIRNHILMYAGEIDGMPEPDSLKNLSNARFVELKTLKEGRDLKSTSITQNQMYKWWAQCVISNTDTVLVGYRNDATGKVHSIEKLRVDSMPSLAKGAWSPNQSFEYVDFILNKLKYDLSKDTDVCFVWKNKQGLNVEQFYCDDMGQEVIPQFYEDWLKKLRSKSMKHKIKEEAKR